jgi:hypothetical protein
MKEIKTESNNAIKQRNELRQSIAYESLNVICSRLGNELATPYKIDVICSLMENEKYKKQSTQYFIKIIEDNEIECDYRYKSILSLERKKINDVKFHLYKSLLSFTRNKNNLMMYRILSSQYLLQSIKELMSEDEIKEVENCLLDFAENEENEYNLRADASDVLLSLGSDEMKIKGREIIMKLGGKGNTVFENKQNVHVKEIEKSVMKILETICYVPIMKNNDGESINFDYVDEEIQKLVDDTNDKEKILISLNRIRMDRTLYSTLSITLSVVMVKLWSYICSNENKIEMQKRLLQELEDMAGTCSSGFISRLVNTISGFGELSIQISFEDQVISNFSARLNSYAQKICEEDSIFRHQALDAVIKLYLKENPEKDDIVVDAIIEEFYDAVLNEMMLSSSDYKNRPRFLLFFRTYMSKIREEMFKGDFKLISPCVLEPHTGEQTIWKPMRPWHTGTTRVVPYIDYQAPMFSRELAEKLYPIPDKLIYGWGIDCLSAMVCNDNNWKIGVCDKTPTIHLVSQTINLFPDELSDTNSVAEVNMFKYFVDINKFDKFKEIRDKAFNYTPC